MIFSAEFMRKAVNGAPRESAILAPVVRKCAGVGAAKCGARAHVDDVEQELWLFLIKNVGRLDETYNVEPYLIATAFRIARALLRKFTLYGHQGSQDSRGDGLSDLAGQEIASPDEAIDSLTDRTEQQQAMDYLLSVSAALRAVTTKEDDLLENLQMRKTIQPLKKFRELSKEQIELRRVRLDLNLSQMEMASRVGCKLPTYQAYEYGKTNSVKPQVMDAARKLKVNPKFSHIDTLYGRKKMWQIAAEWATRLGIEQNRPTEMAALLGVDKATTSRWMNKAEKVIPAMELLVTYERRVSHEEKWRATRSKGRNVH